MRHPETLLNSPINNTKLNGFNFDEIGDDHLYTGIETPYGHPVYEEFRNH